jgi:RHS repeat-associated protein
LADVLITHDDALYWSKSRGKEGFDPALRVASDPTNELRPRVLFADGTETLFLADMSGDGLVDIVRIRNSNVCYWPSRGYGRFGDKITLQNAPQFDAPDQFDPGRIRLADIDGSGTTDILYLRSDAITIVFNQSGNSLAPAQFIDSLPSFSSALSIEVADVLGGGTACLVWSSPLPAQRDTPLMLIDLLGGKKPHLLTSIIDNFGGETLITYGTSTRAYLHDKAAGRRWITRLPFPVHVVTAVAHVDRVADTRVTTTYKYHHGYYDGQEREFLGFAFVEQRDAEEFDPKSKSGELKSYPVLTKMWFHTGVWLDRTSLEIALSHEFWTPDKRPATLPKVNVPQGLTPGEEREATRALRGLKLREEIYWEDQDQSLRSLPYSVSQTSYEIRSIQRRGEQRHGAFLAHDTEILQYYYERDPGDPRVEHQLTLAVDEFGNVLQSAAIGYPRIQPLYDEQKRVWCKLAEAVFTNESSRDDGYRFGVPVIAKQWELCGLPPNRFSTSDQVRKAVAAAVEIPYEKTADAALPQKRLIEAECVRYWRDDVGGPLPFLEVGRRAIVYQKYGLALTSGVIADGLGDDRVTEEILANECHYVNGATAGISPLFRSLPPRSWWIPSGTLVPDPSRFYLPKEAIDAFGAKTRIDHDTNSIMVVRTTDARQNVTEADVDYRVLNVSSVTDPNGNVSLFSFNALGLVTSITLAGKNGEGDTKKNPTTEFRYELRRWVDGIAIPPNVNKHPAPVRVHAKSHVMHGHDNTRWEESYVYTDGSGREVMRKVLAEPGDAPMKGPDEKLIRNPDGSPQLHPVKIRWIGTGRTIYDNKGHPIKKYEPFFSDSFEYESEDEVVQWGVTPVLHYDPIGRLVRTDNPDGTFSEVRFYPWRTEHWDENDTVLRSTWLKEYQDGTPEQKRAARLASDHADTPAILHMDTLGRPFLAVADNKERGSYETRSELDIEGIVLSIHDAKGRVISRNHHDIAGRRLQEWLADSGTRWRLPDVADKPVRQWDARDFVQRWVYDVLQRPTHLFVSNSSSRLAPFGEAEPIAEPAQESPASRRSAPGLWARTFGRARPRSTPYIQNGGPRPPEPGSPASILIAPSPGDELLVERRYYGEDLNDDQHSHRWNLRTRLALIFDGAGALRNDGFDFKGNLTRSTRLLAREYRLDPDWAILGPVQHAEDAKTAAKTLLEPTEFATQTAYDALNRTIRRVSPDKSVTHFGYNERGLVVKIDVQIRGVDARTEFVRSVAYNARSQRCRIDYGNTALTTYRYNERTFRLAELGSTRTRAGRTEKMQRSIYTYDPVGNILSIQDKSDAAIFFAGKVLPGDGAYEYDAVYQLVKAAGREHPSMAPAQEDTPISDIPHPNDKQALQRYVESYVYDEVGNVRTVTHRVDGSTRWTRSYSYAPDSNRLATTETSGSAAIRYRHDERGNIDQMPHLKAMRWDFGNRLRYADLGGGGKVWFSYDSNGQRVRKRYIHNGIIEQRIYRDELEMYDRSASGARTGGGSSEISRETLHVMNGSQRFAMVETKTRDSSLRMLRPQPRLRYQLANHLGSAAVELDEKAAVISFEEYYAFGATSFHCSKGGAEVSAKRYRYVGKERDDETGFYYHGARYYAAFLARWVSCEPLAQESLTKLFSADTRSSLFSNAYAAVYNNPISNVDLDGRNATTMDGSEVIKGLRAGFASFVQATSAVLSHPAVVATMQISSGIAETAIAATMLAAPEPVATKVAGVALLAHAADQFSAGLRTILSGRAQQSLTSQLAEHGAIALGASPRVARWVGIGADIAVPALLAGVPMLARATTGARGEFGAGSTNLKQIKPELGETTPTASEWASMTSKQKGDWGVAEHMKSLLEREHKIVGREIPIELPSGKTWKIDILSVSPEGVPRAWEIKTGMGSPTPNQWEAFTKGISGKFGGGVNLAELKRFAEKEMSMSLREFASQLKRGYVPMNAPH